MMKNIIVCWLAILVVTMAATATAEEEKASGAPANPSVQSEKPTKKADVPTPAVVQGCMQTECDAATAEQVTACSKQCDSTTKQCVAAEAKKCRMAYYGVWKACHKCWPVDRAPKKAKSDPNGSEPEGKADVHKSWPVKCMTVTGAKADKDAQHGCACSADDEVAVPVRDFKKREVEVSCVYAASAKSHLERSLNQKFNDLCTEKDSERALRHVCAEIANALVIANEAKANASVAVVIAKGASKDAADAKSRVNKLERSMLRLSVLGGMGLMRRGEPGLVADLVGTICVSGSFSARLGVGGCGSFGSMVLTSTTPVGLEAGGMLGMSINLDPAARHRLLLGIGGRQFVANGQGVGYEVGPEVRYLGAVAGPFTLSPTFGVGWGNVSGWSPETKKAFNLERSATIRLGFEVGFSTGVF